MHVLLCMCSNVRQFEMHRDMIPALVYVQSVKLYLGTTFTLPDFVGQPEFRLRGGGMGGGGGWNPKLQKFVYQK